MQGQTAIGKTADISSDFRTRKYTQKAWSRNTLAQTLYTEQPTPELTFRLLSGDESQKKC